jgi:cytochrome P450
VTTGLSFIAWHLATHPEHQQFLRAHPERIPAVMEELLRRYAFVNPPRRVARDVVFHGVPMKKDDYIICSITAASNDEDALGSSSEVDLGRTGAPSLLIFNTGPHSCAGANLARMEIRIFLEEWLARVPEFRLAEGHKPHTKSTPLFGVEELQLVW